MPHVRVFLTLRSEQAVPLLIDLVKHKKIFNPIENEALGYPPLALRRVIAFHPDGQPDDAQTRTPKAEPARRLVPELGRLQEVRPGDAGADPARPTLEGRDNSKTWRDLYTRLSR